MNTASAYFNENWERYQQTMKYNAVFHREMFSAFEKYLNKHYSQKPFSLLDVGCGDASRLIPILLNKPITNYVGIDAASEVLKLADENAKLLSCDKQFICDDMQHAVGQIQPSFDIIFTSLCIHHLTIDEKYQFLHQGQHLLNDNGVLIMIDGVIEEMSNRQDWLSALEQRFKICIPNITNEEIDFRMQHPRSSDFPEKISTFERIANEQKWSNFQVVADEGIVAMMVFNK